MENEEKYPIDIPDYVPSNIINKIDDHFKVKIFIVKGLEKGRK